MKIAVITDDGETISQHFGRARYYKVYTVQDGQITGSELREKMGHRQFSGQDHDHHDHDHEHHGHDHEHHGHGHDDPRGHGFGPVSDRRHSQMVVAITDCEVLIVRGMGRGAYLAMEAASIRPVVSDIPAADDAVGAYLAGTLQDHTELLH